MTMMVVKQLGPYLILIECRWGDRAGFYRKLLLLINILHCNNESNDGADALVEAQDNYSNYKKQAWSFYLRLLLHAYIVQLKVAVELFII